MDFVTQFFIFIFHFWVLITSSIASNQIPQPYVIYMGSSTNGNNEDSHLKLLSSIIPSQQSDRISLIHHYNHAFRGFSAMLTEIEASALSGNDEVVSIFLDRILQLHTTRSWDFLESESGIHSGFQYHGHSSNDVIVGIIDTGIWPESPSFNDNGIGEIPSRWKGICMEGPDFKHSNCNRKLIGARYYNTPLRSHENRTHMANPSGSPRDSIGHGTHTASIAAGAPVTNASYFGLARGIARGGSPSTRIAAYKACSEDGCSGSTILKAIDDAIKDGVDIISISIGMNSIFQADYLNDPIAIGAFHAEKLGVLVVCSGGNDGPDPFTVVNSAPWIFTIAASSIDRDFQSFVLLGNGKTYRGSAINFSNLTHSDRYPLAFGNDVAAKFTPESEARNCYPGSLDPKKVAGKIIVCLHNDPTASRRIKKLFLEDAKAKGLILIDEYEKSVPFDSGIFPFTEVGNTAGFHILQYINSTKHPTATILPTIEIPRSRPAPVVAYFSSRGPGGLTENILKPDITAPGVAILAALIPKVGEGGIPARQKPSKFAIKSGTSMACPHVTGAAAFIKSVHRKWTSSMIKSALMTTATTSNNMGKPMTNSSSYTSNPHEMGVGEINPIKALNPGLVYETTTTNYLEFLCFYGYPEKHIKTMSHSNFKCPNSSSYSQISNVNYPSISLSKLNSHNSPQTVKRTVTNVGSSPNSTYKFTVNSPIGIVVNVHPNKLIFTKGVTRKSFQVSFYSKDGSNGYKYGSIILSDGHHFVHTTFAVNVV